MSAGSEPPDTFSERVKLVGRAREEWKSKLVDRSRRNRLLYFRDLKVGTLDLTTVDPRHVDSLIAGRSVPLRRMFDEDDLPQAQGKALVIRRHALTNLEEKGLETLFVALGMATWKPADEGRPAASPILLIPVSVDMRGSEGTGTSLRRNGDLQVNEILLHELQLEFGIGVESEWLLGGEGEGEEGDTVRAEEVYSRVRTKAGRIPGFDISHRVVLGNFAFQKMAMLKDLDELSEDIVLHDLVAAIAGDAEARRAVFELQQDVDPSGLDELAPADEPLILDADSSQRRAIQAVARGQHGVIQGPPGTGKSQTIANIIAATTAQGKRILFVAEKRAALEAVLVRLEEVGLRHLALDLHGASVRRRQVLEQVRESLELIRSTERPQLEHLDEKLGHRRASLNRHVRRLHDRLDPFTLSPYEVIGELLRVPARSQTDVRFPSGVLDQLDAEAVEEIQDAIDELSSLASIYCGSGDSPWIGARIDDSAYAQVALRLARDTSTFLPSFERKITEIASSAGLPVPSTTKQAGETIDLMLGTNATLALYEPGIYGSSLDGDTGILGRAEGGRFRAFLQLASNRSFRDARRRVRGFRREKTTFQQLLHEARLAATQLSGWKRGGAKPRAVPQAEEGSPLLDKLSGQLTSLGAVTGRSFDEVSLSDLRVLLGQLARDSRTPFQVAQVSALVASLRVRGMGTILDELRERESEAGEWPTILRQVWLSSLWERILEEYPEFASFDGRQHERILSEFRQLDREHVSRSSDRIRRAHAEFAVSVRNRHPEEDAIVRREANKKSRHMAIRKLFGSAQNVLTALRPCWMASPLSVSQLLAPVEAFDYVLFDEASQVLPHDAIPSLVRGKFAVVAGDEHQLPPTTFFAYTGEEDQRDEETQVATEGFESLLKVMASILEPWRLQWHYRSRSEELIAFSNRFIYEKKDGHALITFPAAWREGVVSHILVDQSRPSDVDEESSSAEVTAVVDQVLEHAAAMISRPEDEWESLGVIAMGIKHANRIQASLDKALAERPELGPFFAETRLERTFVKNLERVQGDERDVIFLSIGYARNQAGILRHHFGPINNEGGERRLNVAVTRAKKRMAVFSSFSPHDLDPRKLRAEGAKLLKGYLEYTASGGRDLGERGVTQEPMNPFEMDVFEALRSRGVDVIPQYGLSPYRLDFAVQHPRQPGRFVLAIECDGASYHAAQTARDRDRLRQQELEARGWRFHRIWSTDWFHRREDELDRTIAAIERAVEIADRRRQEEPRMPAVQQSRGAPEGRPPPPPILRGLKISEYWPSDLDAVMDWIMADGYLRTDEEMVREAMEFLEFRRRGKNILDALSHAARRWRQRNARASQAPER